MPKLLVLIWCGPGMALSSYVSFLSLDFVCVAMDRWYHVNQKSYYISKNSHPRVAGDIFKFQLVVEDNSILD
jgi:hypothetical protein